MPRTPAARGDRALLQGPPAHPASSQEAWEGLDAISKQRLLTALIAKATDYATRSAAAGGFDAKEAHISTDALKLDRQGLDELAHESRKWLARAREIEREAAERTRSNPESALPIGLTPMPFQSAAIQRRSSR